MAQTQPTAAARPNCTRQVTWAAACALAAGVAAAPATAGVVQLDDLAFGTDAVVRDTTHGTDWLRLDFTAPFTYSQVQLNLGAGGLFEGWTLARNRDVARLGIAAGIVHGSTDPLQILAAETLRDWLCFSCVSTSSTHVYARGLTTDQTQQAGALDAFTVGRYTAGSPDEVDFRVSGFGFADVKGDLNEGVWLLRDVGQVPEPASLALVLLSLALLAGVNGRARVTWR